MNPKYLVIEIQTNKDGSVGNLVFAFDTMNEAYAKYHAILSVAAVSNLPMHSAVILTNDCNLIAQQFFTHEQA